MKSAAVVQRVTEMVELLTELREFSFELGLDPKVRLELSGRIGKVSTGLISLSQDIMNEWSAEDAAEAAKQAGEIPKSQRH